MFKSVKQVRAAVSLVNPEAVRALASRRIAIGLAAGSSSEYAELEDFLVPAGVAHETRLQLMEGVYRAGDPDVPDDVDLVLCGHGTPCPSGAFSFRRDEPQTTVTEILRAKDDLALPLARQFPAFRRAATDRIVQAVACLPNVIRLQFRIRFPCEESCKRYW